MPPPNPVLWDRITAQTGSSVTFAQCTLQNASYACLNVLSNAQVSVTGCIIQDALRGIRFQVGNFATNAMSISGNRFQKLGTGIEILGRNVTIGNNRYFEQADPMGQQMTGVAIRGSAENTTILGGSMNVLRRGVDIFSGAKNVLIRDLTIGGDIGIHAIGGVGRLDILKCSIRATLEGIYIQSWATGSAGTGYININEQNAVSSYSKSAIRINNTSGHNPVQVNNNTISPITGGLVSSPGIYGVGITNTHNSPVQIFNNIVTPYFSSAGIYVFECKAGVQIDHNKVVADLGNISDALNGIVVSTLPRASITNNLVDGGFNWNDQNISIDNISESLLVECNSVDRGDKGLYIMGVVPDGNTEIKSTTFHTHEDALYYNMVVSQSATQIHEGNTWASATTTWDGYLNGNSGFAPFLKYEVDPTLLPNGLTKIFVSGGSPGTWFQVNTGAETTCIPVFPSLDGNPGGGTVTGVNGITNTDIWAINPLSEADHKYAAIQYEAQRNLYEKLQKDPGLSLTSAPINTFWGNAQSGNLHKLWHIKSELDGLDTALDPSAVLSQLEVVNAGIVPTNTAEVYEKTINAILLNAMIQNDWTFSESEKASLDAIAADCPERVGRSVYRARGLQEHYRIPDWSMSACGQTEFRSGPSVIPNVGKTLITPNPAQDRLNINFENALAEQVVFQLFTATGNLVKSEIFPAGGNQAQIETINLPHGVYFAKITQGNTLIHQQKIVVIH